MSEQLKTRLKHQLDEAEKKLQELQKSNSNVDKLQAIALVNKISTLKFKIETLK